MLLNSTQFYSNLTQFYSNLTQFYSISFLKVHVVLYLYYGLTAIGIHPPWKKQLTEIQIIQFFIDLVHASIGLLHHNFCTWSIIYALSMIYLFGSFYYRTYYLKANNKAVNNISNSMEERKKLE